MKPLTGSLIVAGAFAAIVLYLIAAYGAATVTLALNSGPEKLASLEAVPSAGSSSSIPARIGSAQFGAFEVAVPDAEERSLNGSGPDNAYPCDKPPSGARHPS